MRVLRTAHDEQRSYLLYYSVEPPSSAYFVNCSVCVAEMLGRASLNVVRASRGVGGPNSVRTLATPKTLEVSRIH